MPIKDVPPRIQAKHVTVVELVADFRIAFVVNFVAGKNADPWTQLAPVDDILSIFDFDLVLARFDQRPLGVGPDETFVQRRGARLILQLTRDFERRLLGIGWEIHPE